MHSIKRIGLITVLTVLSGLAIWRASAIWSQNWLFSVGLLAGCAGFGWGIHRLSQIKMKSRFFLALLGAALCGGVGFLGTTPAGLSRVRLQIFADHVWSPDIFSAVWADMDNGLEWSVPFALPMGNTKTMPLVIQAGSSEQGESAAEVWLVDARRADGSAIPMEGFQAESGWSQREIDWDNYQNRSVWVGNQATELRWQGKVSGPVTLVFAQHNRAGSVSVQWDEEGHETIDLYAPEVTFRGVTLPVGEAVVWEAELPLTVLRQSLHIAMEPDPEGDFPAVIQKVRLSGIEDQEVAGAELISALDTGPHRATVVGEGIQLHPKKPGESLQIELTGPLAVRVAWSWLIPFLENGLLVLFLMGLGAGLVAPWPSSQQVMNWNLAGVSLLFALLVGEIGLRWYLPSPQYYYPRPPYLHHVYRPASGVMPGIDQESHYITNSLGIRGDEFSSQDDYRILAIGGSTTESLFVDQPLAWPQQVQTKLSDQQSLRVWVGNVGQSGRSSRENLMHLRYLLPQYPEIDAVLLLVGVNDLMLRLRQGEEYNPYYLQSPAARQVVIQTAFHQRVKQNPYQPYYQQSGLWRLWQQIQQTNQAQVVEAIEVEDEVGQSYVDRRKQRQNAPKRDELPDLSAALAEYERNLEAIVEIAEAHKVRLIFLTQPTIWRSDLTAEEQALLWFGGGPDRQFYYSIEALQEGMMAYNQRLFAVCQKHQIECVDLAERLPRDTTVFYDDVHFNVSGSTQIADILTAYFLEQPPFEGIE